MNKKPKPTDTIIFEDAQLVSLLEKKDELVAQGRKVSTQIEDVQEQINKLTEKETKLTGAVKPKELIKEGNALRDKINKDIKKLDDISNKIRKEKMKAIPKEMEKEHLALNDKREKLEQERNKIALKVQKIKDRFVPKIQRMALPHIGEFEDLLTADLKDGKIYAQKFSHLQEWKRQYNERNGLKKNKKKAK